MNNDSLTEKKEEKTEDQKEGQVAEQPKPEVAAAPAAEPTSAPEVEFAAEQTKPEVEAKPESTKTITTSDLRPGMTVRVHQKIKEGDKERIQIFQGIVIALRGQTPETKTVTLRKKSFGVGVEKIFPLASPLIAKIELVKTAKVRRAKLYFLRDYAKRLKETLAK